MRKFICIVILFPIMAIAQSQINRGDVNEDGVVDAADIVNIVKIIMQSQNDNDSNTIDNNADFDNISLFGISEEIRPNLFIKEGYVSQKSDTIRIMRDGKAIAIVRLSEPVQVSQASEPEGWGFFQFPKIFRNEKGHLIVKWQMRADSHTDYGIDSFGRRISYDEGETWIPLDEDCLDKEQYRVELRNGGILQVKDPTSKNITEYSDFPLSINDYPINKRSFYFESDLPDDLRGVFLEYYYNNQSTIIHASLNDSALLRYTIDDLMPIVWWGNLKELADETLVAGIYGSYYPNSDNKPLRSSVSFYGSNDRGHNWTIIGKIPYQPADGNSYDTYIYDGEDGFTEPAFEILKDSTYICVMRTGMSSPMYRSFSKDRGKHWSIPEPFTPNGVMPNILRLDNGSLVLTSGRPGLQVRFCIDGDGRNWTEPIEMLPYTDINGNYNLFESSCGYSNILAVNNNTFYLVYSDFKTRNDNGENRKSILFRKIEVLKK